MSANIPTLQEYIQRVLEIEYGSDSLDWHEDTRINTECENATESTDKDKNEDSRSST